MFLRTAFGTVDVVVDVEETTVVDGASVLAGASVPLGASVLIGASVVVELVVVVGEVVVVGMGNELESPYWNNRTPAAQRRSYLPIGY